MSLLVYVFDYISIFALVGSTPQGLTKAETIQVKGNNCHSDTSGFDLVAYTRLWSNVCK